MSRKSNLVTVGPERVPFHCLACRGQLFSDQEIKLNTSGMELLDLGWANRSGTGLICDRCSFVHTFAGDGFELWESQRGLPALSPAAATGHSVLLG